MTDLNTLQVTVARAVKRQTEQPQYTQAQFNQFLDAHERFVRRQPRGYRASMHFVQAAGVDFGGRLMTEVDFTGGSFRGARLVRAHFERANLFCADLRSVDAHGANFVRADLRGVSLRGANLSGAAFDEADLRAAVLVRADADGGFRLAGRAGTTADGGAVSYSVDFTNCSMKRVILAKSKLRGANFTGAVLTGSDLQGADLSGAVFEGAVIAGVDMDGARFDPGALVRCVLAPSAEAIRRAPQLIARLNESDRWVATGGTEGRAAVLDGEDLRPLGPVFANRRLTALSASRACAVGAGFAGAQLQCAKFDGADLRDADFTGADLRGASFKGANLGHALFKNADLRPLALASGQARAVDLAGASYADDSFAGSRRD